MNFGLLFFDSSNQLRLLSVMKTWVLSDSVGQITPHDDSDNFVFEYKRKSSSIIETH